MPQLVACFVNEFSRDLLGVLLRASIDGAFAAVVIWAVARAWVRCPAGLRSALWWLVCARFVVSLAWPAPLQVPVLPRGWVLPGQFRLTSDPARGQQQLFAPDVVLSGKRSNQALRRDAAANRDSLITSQQASPLATVSEVELLPQRGTQGSTTAVNVLSWWPAMLLALWVVGVFAGTTRVLRKAYHARRVLADAVPAPARVQRSADSLAEALNISRPPPVLLSSRARGPCLVLTSTGPSIVLPLAFAQHEGDNSDLRCALAHELVHVRRRDLAWTLVPLLAEQLLFFHPLARLAAREFVVAREAACDAAALGLLRAPADAYARLIVRFSVSPAATPVVGMGGSGSSFRLLKRRLLMLNQPSSSRRISRTWILAAGVVGLVPLQLASRPAPAISDSKPATVTTGVEDGIRGGVAGGVTGGVRDGVADGVARGVAGGIETGITGDVQTAPPPSPPVPPAPPVPPPPPPPEWSFSFGDNGWRDFADAWVFLGEGHRMSAATNRQLARAEGLREGKAPIFWFSKDGKEYVIRDPATLKQIEDAFAPQRELGKEQGRVGGDQGALGAKMGELAARQGALGAKQAEFAAVTAASTERELARASEELRRAAATLRGVDAQWHSAEFERAREELRRAEENFRAFTATRATDAAASRAQLASEQESMERERTRLAGEQERLAREQERLGREMEKLAQEQVRLARQHQDLGSRISRELSDLIDRAIKDGRAEIVK